MAGLTGLIRYIHLNGNGPLISQAVILCLSSCTNLTHSYLIYQKLFQTFCGWPNWFDRKLHVNAMAHSVVQLPYHCISGSARLTNSHKNMASVWMCVCKGAGRSTGSSGGHPLRNWCFIELGPRHKEGSTVFQHLRNTRLITCTHSLNTTLHDIHNITSYRHQLTAAVNGSMLLNPPSNNPTIILSCCAKLTSTLSEPPKKTDNRHFDLS